ncbi:RnfABCDGE type electron transport complex subunit C [Candidatus Nitrosoglobus terrae]|uniref:Ion-translocating oxidoreductase complex subunit C n=1 Tax=Candidatus Nitrosoglobus terrae TaxID=1630141 RepID=A0A1Q2SML2_9GAMM|nr:electron transport complex subunit RsxC [Candidatus Nitrosoglobus terrae]BAW80361.1 RnfABCDGE type electron transport complex subunit C [Candidatus Nitrosoglobus terrae]
MKARQLWSFFGGLTLPDGKNQSTQVPITQADLPEYLIFPLQQPTGNLLIPVVKIGDIVLKGEVVAKAQDNLSVPVHASSSGKVIGIENLPILHPSGLQAPCIIIETDGKETWIDRYPFKDYQQLDPSYLRNLIREMGIIGLGGAGFPTFIKLNSGAKAQVQTLIINGAESEPYISCDDLLMRERAHEIIQGIAILRHALQACHCLMGIEDNKPEAYAALTAAVTTGIEIIKIPTRYPAGGEKQLIKTLTGKEVTSRGLPIDIGVVCHNVGTAAAVYRAIHLGQPLTSRIITVTGSAIDRPKNLEVLLGTPIYHLLNQCRVDQRRINHLIIGGPMMGFTLNDINLPVVKTTNCLLVGIPEPNKSTPVMPCIRCGACAEVCPAHLLPQQLYWYTKAKELDKAQDYHLFDCIECGCCAYVCPSHIPLVHYYRYAKSEIQAQKQEQEQAHRARQRYEFRHRRLEQEQQEQAARQQMQKASLSPSASEDKKRALIQAAVERARSKRIAQKEKLN